jgi:hypothetical protein
LFGSVIAAILVCFSFNAQSISYTLWAIPLTLQVAYVIIFCSFHFRLAVFLPQFVVKFAILFALHLCFKVILDIEGRATSLPLDNPVVGLSPFSPWTGVCRRISCADDEQCTAVTALRASFVRAGCTTGSQGGVRVGVIAVSITAPCSPFIMDQCRAIFCGNRPYRWQLLITKFLSIAGERTKRNNTVRFRHFVAFLSYFAIIYTEEHEIAWENWSV